MVENDRTKNDSLTPAPSSRVSNPLLILLSQTNLRVKSYFLAKQTDCCYILGSPNPYSIILLFSFEGNMSDIVRILLISLLSLTIISCSKKDESESSESSGSSGSNIQLSNIKANLAGKSLFISTGNKSTYSTTNNEVDPKSRTVFLMS